MSEQSGLFDPRPVLVVFEGTDGSGKSTLSKVVAEQRLYRWARPPVHMAFPSKDGEVGKLIRRAFAREVVLGDGIVDGTQDRVFGYLMVADLVDRSHLIRRHLTARTSVVCDRYATVSGWAYQLNCMSVDELLAVQQRARLVRPDVVFLLDVPPAVAVERMRQRGEIKNPIFERDGFAYVEGLRRRYLAYASLHDEVVVVLDGTRSVDDLHVEVLDHLSKLGAVKP